MKRMKQRQRQGSSFPVSASVSGVFDFSLLLHKPVLGSAFSFDQTDLSVVVCDEAFRNFNLFPEFDDALCSGCSGCLQFDHLLRILASSHPINDTFPNIEKTLQLLFQCFNQMHESIHGRDMITGCQPMLIQNPV